MYGLISNLWIMHPIRTQTPVNIKREADFFLNLPMSSYPEGFFTYHVSDPCSVDRGWLQCHMGTSVWRTHPCRDPHLTVVAVCGHLLHRGHVILLLRGLCVRVAGKVRKKTTYKSVSTYWGRISFLSQKFYVFSSTWANVTKVHRMNPNISVASSKGFERQVTTIQFWLDPKRIQPSSL